MNYSISPDQRALIEEQLDRGGASKRARLAVELIFELGSCTTSDLEERGYSHPPRALGDVRDAGVVLGKKMESYEDPRTGTKKRRGRYFLTGDVQDRQSRKAFSKKLTNAVKASGHCAVCGATPPLQVDHKIPFEIGGETYPHVVAEFQPLCPSCNRAKSWDCEHCGNWTVRDKEVCRDCMWASPEDYRHVAMKQVRQVRVTLEDPEDIALFDEVRPDVEQIIREYLRK